MMPPVQARVMHTWRGSTHCLKPGFQHIPKVKLQLLVSVVGWGTALRC